MVKYVKCPRCDLNYIDAQKQEYCDVCIAELKGKKLQFADLDEELYEEADAELEQFDICPVCNVNRIRYGEKLCEACKKESEYEEEEVDLEKDEEWKNYLDEEDDGDLTVDDETLQEELDEELEDEENGEESEDDFFEDVDSLSDLEDDEYDDEEDDDEYDDDDDF